ncbi:nickel pincer cofactor biosynthesis protein LarC [Geodermatophilaceae bacterium NBWT11]|nr:nickel pincer cofactor biosynthesis protein LarC [Geodermatophilaceae bacterium NBWT11]
MLLGALVDAGVPLAVVQDAVAGLPVEPVLLRTEQVTRHGLGATRVHVDAPPSTHHRTWADVRELLGGATLDDAVRERALAVFARLAAAEGRVHRVPADEVHFHEVGALDALADVVGVVAGFAHLGLAELHATSVALGSGTARGEHGVVPVPGPAVLELLTGLPVHAGPVPHECCTPTGAALVAELVDVWGPLPGMRPALVGSGAGGRDPVELPNAVRLVLGEPVATPGTPVVLEANIDDLDPRLWPGVLDALFAAGASDAWLTPILMKKGRPAHTLAALCRPETVAAVQRAVFAHTPTIGLRVSPVGKVALARSQDHVDVLGGRVGTKTARDDAGRVLNVSVEFEDVAALARERGLPVKEVLRAATAAAWARVPGGEGE